ncbi:MAG: beta-hydroxyacyl-ACP dehydratase [Clostridiales bacterium]|jgi:3-hydroxyacyl-[acyl-carrier-protein] dehydratase|nr:beta-hydroxyacyl-ACP dehydratase [Clostridiales bacterium]
MNREDVQNILPHRGHMLLIDGAELRDGVSVGRYTVRGDEFFLQGHFPGNPVVPGVILCEMMGQSACLLIKGISLQEKWTPYLTGLKRVKFKQKVKPGDTIEFQTELVQQKDSFYFIKGNGFVGKELCVSGELSFAAVKEE